MISVTGAFETNYANALNVQDPKYNWSRFDRNGNPLPPLMNKTVVEAKAITGCYGSAQLCAIASGGPTIRYS